MSSSVCFIRSDLSQVRPLGRGVPSAWTAPALTDADRDNARAFTERAQQAASWYAGSGARRRIDALVVDVDESVCFFVHTPSLARPVLAASVRTSGQDWGELAPTAGLEPLAEEPAPSRKKARGGDGDGSGGASGTSVAVISQTDSLVRLWLDHLDGRGVKVSGVLSLWHAIARAWGEASDSVIAVIVAEPHRLVWAWTRQGGLLCGGTSALSVAEPSPVAGASEDAAPARGVDSPADMGIKRLTLDWLTWSSHLGTTPARVVFVGAGAGALVDALRKRWPELDALAVVEADPIGAMGDVLSARAGEAELSPAQCLMRLSARPTRATRWKYAWAAAALVLAGLGLGSLGYRLSHAAGEIRVAAGELRQRTLANVTSAIPEPDPFGNVVMQMETAVAALRKAPAFVPPPSPPKIFAELGRVCDALASHPGARLNTVAFSTDQATLSAVVPERRDGEELAGELKAGEFMEWTPQRDSSGTYTSLNLTGKWRKR